MAWTKMSTVPNPVMDSNGDVASGYVLKCYLPGTTTATSISTDSSGGTTVASMTTNAAGVWEVSGNEVVPHIDRKVKWGIFANATHATASTPFAIGPFDNVEQSSSTASTVTYTPAGAGAVATDVQTKLRESVSVKDFGAVGDGVTDDTAAIQAAIDYAASLADGADVLIPPSSGKYIITSIQNKTKATLRGTGGVLKLKDSTATNGATNYYPIYNLTGTDCGYVDLEFHGNSANNATFNLCDSITCTGEASFVIGCRIIDSADSGIMFSGATHGRCLDNYVIGSTDAGIYVNTAEGSNNLEGAVIANNSIQDCDYGGINIKRGTANIVVDGNAIENCGNGITVEDFGVGAGGNPEDLVITNNLIRDCGWNYRSLSPSPSEAGIALQHARNCVISGNKLVNVSGVLLDINGAQGCVIANNSLSGYPSDPKTISFGNVGILLSDRTKATGSHDGSNNASVLADSSQSFIVNDLAGLIINNTTDGSTGTITSNSATTVTATLTGGTDNDWDAGDAYTIISRPSDNSIAGNVVRNLEDEGIYIVDGDYNIIANNIVRDVDNAGGGNQAFRADADATNNVIQGNIFYGPTNDYSFSSSASDNIFHLNKLPNTTGININGFRRYTGFSTPVSNVVPLYSGEVVSTTSGGQKLWQSYGTTNADWLQIG